MRKWLSLSAGILCCAFASRAHAENVRFVCNTEESASLIGEALIEGQDEADEVAQPFLMLGECHYFSEEMFVYIVHRGTTYGTTWKVTVVGLSRKIGELPDMWGLMATEELHGDGSI